ncbi:MAG: hypothetical protein ACK4P2_09845 [Hyphomonas sp.]
MGKSRKTGKAAAQVAPARRAMDLKSAAAAPDHPLPDPTPDEGMISAPQEGQPPSGALDAEGHRPVLERSRKVR